MISFGITVHDEAPEYLIPLFDKLLRLKQPEDEIIVVDDYSSASRTIEILQSYTDRLDVYQHALDNNFAGQKNYLNSKCKGSHIFQIDADETIHDVLLGVLPEILMMNPTVDLFTLPRINIVSNITQEDINRWGWKVNDKQWINYPDRQTRIYKNSPSIYWENKVHERIVGHELHADFPETVEYSILHFKTIERQRVQNAFYEQIK